MRAEDFIRSRGYRRCNIAACNCGSWHGGHAENRLHDICDAVRNEDVSNEALREMIVPRSTVL